MEQPVDISQQSPTAQPVESSQVQAPVTAGAPAPDNATPNSPQQVDASQVTDPQVQTGRGVDEGKKESYAERKARLLSQPAKAPEKAPAKADTPPPGPTPPAPAPTDEDDFPVAPKPGERIPAIKIRPVTPVDVQAMAEFKASQMAGNTQSFVEYIQSRYPSSAAAGDTGDAGGQAQPGDAGTSDTPTVARVDAELASLKEAKRTALRELDFDEVIRIEDRQEELQKQRDTLLVEESSQQEQAVQQWTEQSNAYLVKVATMFPQTLQANDPLVAKANEVMQEWAAAGDPRAAMPSGNLYCYVEAAAELGIQPAAASPSSSPKPSTPPPVHRAPVTAIIASGNATSTQTRAQADTRSYAERKADYLRKKVA